MDLELARVAHQQVTRSDIDVVSPHPVTLYARRGKRMFDVVVSLILILVLMPILGVLGLALRATLNRGIYFRQVRVGLNGRLFSMLKFRTMDHDRRVSSMEFEGPDRRLSHKSEDDPRHTKIGRFMRKFSLDELPQLVNVLKGEMSLVGPRPELIAVATDDFIDHPRHWVRPGLTGPFQLSELRRTGDLRTGLRLDAEYVGQLSLANDIKLLLKTVVMVLRGQGA